MNNLFGLLDLLPYAVNIRVLHRESLINKNVLWFKLAVASVDKHFAGQIKIKSPGKSPWHYVNIMVKISIPFMHKIFTNECSIIYL